MTFILYDLLSEEASAAESDDVAGPGRLEIAGSDELIRARRVCCLLLSDGNRGVLSLLCMLIDVIHILETVSSDTEVASCRAAISDLRHVLWRSASLLEMLLLGP